MKQPEEPTLLAAEPQLFVRDIAVAARFYLDKLGFSIARSYGEPPHWAQLKRGGARLNLRCVEVPAFAQDFYDRVVDPVSATVTVDGIEQLAAAFEAAGVDWHQKLRREPWGARTFILRDPDGNLLAFAGE